MAKIKMTKKNCQITDRDYKMLRFIWKWKAVSTRALASKFYSSSTAFTCYRRLLYLADNKYIESYPLKGPNAAAWILGQKGFKHIRPYLENLSSEGYKSANYPHDFLASCFHLGEWLAFQPDNSQTLSEQQLRSMEQEFLPKWVPTSKLHIPDGYSTYHVNGQRVIVAFEAELSVKSNSRYESVVNFYDFEETITIVLWLVDGANAASAIQKCFEKHNIKDISKHHFIDLSEFLKKGWMADVSVGKFAGRKVINLLQHKAYSSPTQNILSSVTLAMIDSRKRPIISKK